MYRLSQLIAMLILSVWSFFPVSSVANEKSSVCVMSRLGQTFHMKKVGVLMFGNEYSEHQIPQWKIDDIVLASVEKALNAQFDVEQIAIPGALRKSTEQLRGGLLEDGRQKNAPILSKLVADKTCKYILLITEARSKFGSSNKYVVGLGVVQARGVLGDVRFVHALAQAVIFDGKTYALLD